MHLQLQRQRGDEIGSEGLKGEVAVGAQEVVEGVVVASCPHHEHVVLQQRLAAPATHLGFQLRQRHSLEVPNLLAQARHLSLIDQITKP